MAFRRRAALFFALFFFRQIDQVEIERERPGDGIRGADIESLNQTILFPDVGARRDATQPLGRLPQVLDKVKHPSSFLLADDLAQG